MAASEHNPARRSAPRPWLAIIGVVFGACATLPHFVGPDLGTSDRVEIVDHVVPGTLLIAVSAAVLVLIRRRRQRHSAEPGLLLFAAGLVATLAGLWMTTTHIPLLAQANRGAAAWSAAMYHTSPGLAVLCLGIVWSQRYWAQV